MGYSIKATTLKNDSTAGSLNRAADLITAITQGSRSGSSLAELHASTGIPRPTIYRVMDMLEQLGWVSRDAENAKFNLGHGLAAVGYSAISRFPLDKIAGTTLGLLANQLNQVVYLGIRSSMDVICAGRYESESQIQVGKGHVGLRMPFGMTPSCMPMLVKLPEIERQQILAANMDRYLQIPGFDKQGYLETVRAAEQNGYAQLDGIVLDRTTSGLGVPILDETGYPIAGIGTTYITALVDEQQKKSCLLAMQQAAQTIQLLLSTAQQ